MASQRSGGAVLSQSEIEAHAGLMTHFAPANLRPAGYDVSVGDYAIDASGAKRPLRRGMLLSPGDSAILLTREEFTLPPDIAGNVTIKTGVAGQGILLLSGMLVDPGYKGYLHLTIVNLGSSPFPLKTHDPIAAVQFLPLATENQVEATTPTSDLAERFADGNTDPPVALLEDLRKLRLEHNQLVHDTQNALKLANTVVTLAVVLILATMFGVVVEFALSFASNRNVVGTLRNAAPHSGGGKLLLGLLIVLVIIMIGVVSDGVRKRVTVIMSAKDGSGGQ